MKHILCLGLLALFIARVPTSAATSLREALTFHASFDHGTDADFGQLFVLPHGVTTLHP